MLLDKIQDKEDAVRIEQTQKKQAEYTLIGSTRRVPGHTMFYFNTVTREIGIAKITYSDTIDFWTRKPLHNPRIDTQKNCVYMQALNKKNFIKRLRREGYNI